MCRALQDVLADFQLLVHGLWVAPQIGSLRTLEEAISIGNTLAVQAGGLIEQNRGMASMELKIDTVDYRGRFTTTLVPSPLDVIWSVPPNCRTRSCIPRTPTPALAPVMSR
jgi:hypothetical protein